MSRALHRADLPLSPETRRRVLAAVERLEYRPSAIARGLRLRRTRTLGMLVPDITNPFFPPIIRGAEEAARERGYELVLCNTDDEAEREKASLRVLRERQADGLLIATSRMADATLASVRRERFPFVLVNRGSRVAADPAVEVNNSRAAFEIVAHLVGLGHTRIAHIAGPLSTTTGAENVSTLPVFLFTAIKLGALGCGMLMCPSSTPLLVMTNKRSPTISGEHTARLCGKTFNC